jgi:CHASE3 domain sensor protein
MRIYDIEFDIDSFLDEMEEMQRARRQQQRQRQQQIHRSSDVGTSLIEPALERETD